MTKREGPRVKPAMIGAIVSVAAAISTAHASEEGGDPIPQPSLPCVRPDPGPLCGEGVPVPPGSIECNGRVFPEFQLSKPRTH